MFHFRHTFNFFYLLNSFWCSDLVHFFQDGRKQKYLLWFPHILIGYFAGNPIIWKKCTFLVKHIFSLIIRFGANLYRGFWNNVSYHQAIGDFFTSVTSDDVCQMYHCPETREYDNQNELITYQNELNPYQLIPYQTLYSRQLTP